MDDTAPEPGTPLNAPPPSDVKPIEDKLTLHPEQNRADYAPTSKDGRPDAFVVGDQTAAGALTPEGGRHPGGLPGERGNAANLLDPHNVNGAQANQALVQRGDGIVDPELGKEREPTKDHPRAE